MVGLVSLGVMTNTFSSEWLDHLDRRSLGELLLIGTGVFAPILAVLFSAEPRRS